MSDDQLEAALYESGATTTESYRAQLRSRLQDLDEWSEEAMAVRRKLVALDQRSLKRAMEALRAAVAGVTFGKRSAGREHL